MKLRNILVIGLLGKKRRENDDMKKKEKTIGALVFRYYFFLLIGAFAIAVSCFIVLGILGHMGVICTLDERIQRIERTYERIAGEENVTGTMIPATCQYALFAEDGKFVEGTIPAEKMVAAQAVTTGRYYQDPGYHYVSVSRDNGELCVLRYRLGAGFRNTGRLFDLDPNPHLLCVAAGSVTFGILAMILSLKFSRTLSEKLHVLHGIVYQAIDGESELLVKHSRIREIDAVTDAVNRMYRGMKIYMDRQYEQEQTRREQISALAHDIKTPLTVVGGNAELLEDTPLNENQTRYVQFIGKCAEQIGDYIRQMLEVSRSREGCPIQTEILEMEDFLDQLREDAEGVCITKDQELVFEIQNELGFVEGNMERLLRACMNIISNGTDYTSSHGKIFISACSTDREIEISITDSGRGFSREALEGATQKFFQDDRARTKNAHYGMGMYIAQRIVKQHGGCLTLQNSEETGGAMVTIRLPKVDEARVQEIYAGF